VFTFSAAGFSFFGSDRALLFQGVQLFATEIVIASNLSWWISPLFAFFFPERPPLRFVPRRVGFRFLFNCYCPALQKAAVLSVNFKTSLLSSSFFPF